MQHGRVKYTVNTEEDCYLFDPCFGLARVVHLNTMPVSRGREFAVPLPLWYLKLAGQNIVSLS